LHEKGREELVEGGEMSPEEAGFMKGYEEADKEKEEKNRKKRIFLQNKRKNNYEKAFL